MVVHNSAKPKSKGTKMSEQQKTEPDNTTPQAKHPQHINRELVTAKSISAFLADPTSPPIHNFDGDAMAIWRLTAKACGQAKRLDDLQPGEKVAIRYYYLHYIEMADRATGEVINQVRTALIDDSGTVVGFVSSGVAQGVLQLVDSLGPGPYTPPIEVTVAETRTRSGFRMLSIIPA